jgi:predicted nucleotidyltransferase
MKHSLPTNIQKEDILERIASVLKSHQEIILAYVFGSFNDSNAFSDIDIAVLTAENMHTCLNYELDLEIELEDIVNYPTDVRVINNAPLSFCHNVIRHGRVILDRDSNVRADFMGRILKEYFDFAPFRQRYLEEVANAPI